MYDATQLVMLGTAVRDVLTDCQSLSFVRADTCWEITLHGPKGVEMITLSDDDVDAAEKYGIDPLPTLIDMAHKHVVGGVG